jgi:hypothetical protein
MSLPKDVMNKKARRLITTLAASAAAVVTTFTLAGPANAATETIRTTDANPGGSLAWTAYGDKVTVCDTDADGKFAEGDVYNSKGVFVYSVFASGNGNCTTVDANTDATHNLVEGATYKFEICLNFDYGYEEFCSSMTRVNDN